MTHPSSGSCASTSGTCACSSPRTRRADAPRGRRHPAGPDPRPDPAVRCHAVPASPVSAGGSCSSAGSIRTRGSRGSSRPRPSPTWTWTSRRAGDGRGDAPDPRRARVAGSRRVPRTTVRTGPGGPHPGSVRHRPSESADGRHAVRRPAELFAWGRR
jgi:hypothetical protein